MRGYTPHRLAVETPRHTLTVPQWVARPAEMASTWRANRVSGGPRSPTLIHSPLPRGQTAGVRAVSLGCRLVTVTHNERHEGPRKPLATTLSSHWRSVCRTITANVHRLLKPSVSVPLAMRSWAWWRMNVRHDGDGRLGRRTMSVATVVRDTLMPSMASSPWRRGAPQRLFSRLSRRISARISGAMAGRPGRFRPCSPRTSWRNPGRRQRWTVSACTIKGFGPSRPHHGEEYPKAPISRPAWGARGRPLQDGQLMVQSHHRQRERHTLAQCRGQFLQ
jgi:hypothetical protein